MSDYDFSSALNPEAAPLSNSHELNTFAFEREMKSLTLELFNLLSAGTFDASVMGAPHLGSFDLVRKTVNRDGLVLLRGDREEAATRYLYRAWKSGDIQKRGLHFLRTYLQMLFPNSCEVTQLWHSDQYEYPTALFSDKPIFAWWLHQVGEPGLKLDGSWGLGRHIEGATEERSFRRAGMEGMWLTSRIEISLDLGIEIQSVSRLLQIIRAVIPARLVPAFVFWLNTVLDVTIRTSHSLSMEKAVSIRYPWGGRVITDNPDSRWSLGRDAEFVTLPQPFGQFALGEMRGGLSKWALKNERVQTQAYLEKSMEIGFWRTETLPPDPVIEYELTPEPEKLYRRNRKLNGAWSLGGTLRLGSFKLNGQRLRSRKMAISARLGSFKLLNMQSAVAKPTPGARLTLSGRWKLGSKLHPDFSIQVIKEGSSDG